MIPTVMKGNRVAFHFFFMNTASAADACTLRSP
jgi:hypothetical protein